METEDDYILRDLNPKNCYAREIHLMKCTGIQYSLKYHRIDKQFLLSFHEAFLEQWFSYLIFLLLMNL